MIESKRNKLESATPMHSFNNQIFKMILLAEAIGAKVRPIADPDLSEMLEQIQATLEEIAQSAQQIMQQK